MRRPSRVSAIVAAAIGTIAIGIPVATVSARTSNSHERRSAEHVILISVDGLHQSDLAWYVANHPGSALANLASGGAQYVHAKAPIPSDSFPGIVAPTTGGNPRTTGVYYDASYNHNLLPPGTKVCPPGAPTGTAVNFDQTIDKDQTRLDAGFGLSGLPGSILQMTGSPQSSVIDPSTLPVDPSTCQPVYPHQYLKVNTIFEVARANRLRTAWSDKHPAYEILNGPSGQGIQDLFTPEIDSNNSAWTGDNQLTQQYDSYKVQAVLNEIDGYDHSHSQHVGVPAIFGMNFQTVSTAEKLPTSNGLTGGYLPGTTTPGPLLQRALDYINGKLDAIKDEVEAQGIAGSTAIVISAKHGQSPQDPNDLTRIDDGPIIDGINALWTTEGHGATPLVAASTNDDAIQMWLSDRSKQATDFVANYLLTHTATGNTANGGSRTLQSSGLKRVFAGEEAADYFGVSESDPRHADVWGVVQHGVVYTGGRKKIAEHGGPDRQDRSVPLVVYAPGLVKADKIDGRVETTQIAPTILRLLGLHPSELKAVQIEGTKVLPGS